MVKPEQMSQFVAEVIEQFGFMLGQRISESPLTPKDTGLMRSTFSGAKTTFSKTDKGYNINYTTPFYTEFVHNGTRKMKARPFVNNILNTEGEALLKKAFRIVNARYSNK